MFCPLDMEVRWFINVCFGSPDRDAWGTGLELSLTFTVAFYAQEYKLVFANFGGNLREFNAVR